MAAEWISDGLSEQRITELATYKMSSEAMRAYTIPKDFKTALDPTQRFNYDELPEIKLNEILSITPLKETKKTTPIQAELF